MSFLNLSSGHSPLANVSSNGCGRATTKRTSSHVTSRSTWFLSKEDRHKQPQPRTTSLLAACLRRRERNPLQLHLNRALNPNTVNFGSGSPNTDAAQLQNGSSTISHKNGTPSESRPVGGTFENGAGVASTNGVVASTASVVSSNGIPEKGAGAVSNNGTIGTSSFEEDSNDTEVSPAPEKGKLWKRVLVGVALGLFGGFVILTGKKLFLTMIILVVYQATQEYYGFITSKGISKGMTPPPRFVSVAITVLCMSIAVTTFIFRGRSGVALACAAFTVLSLELLVSRVPKFSQLASSIFGLFYCGWLPAFWVKLRLLSAPLVTTMPLPELVFFGEPVRWTIGLAATFTAVACTIAADTGAYFVGKNFGRTKLTDISPKKTVEGAIGGLLSSVAVALALWKTASWPTSAGAACGLGVLVFFSSLCGDLIESIMKRDAGLKDSGTLFPGHGGLLDRFDSYIFTGAVAYFWVVLGVPFLGL